MEWMVFLQQEWSNTEGDTRYQNPKPPPIEREDDRRGVNRVASAFTADGNYL